MDLGNWMVAVLTLAAVSFVVWVELHCRRNQRRNEREGKRAQDSVAEAVKRDLPK